jgi:hypothetical protein
MNRNDLIQTLTENYESPEIRTLIQSISTFHPVLGIVDAAMSSFLNKRKEKRFRIIFDKLNEGNYILSKEDLYNDDFLYAYFSTINYVLKSRTDEKAEKFAKILKGVYSHEISVDNFEIYMFVLDQLSDREFTALSIKLSFEADYGEDESLNFEMLKSKHWEPFMMKICEVLNTNKEDAKIMLEILNSKGCFRIANTFGGNQERFGDTTEIFRRLCEVLNKY